MFTSSITLGLYVSTALFIIALLGGVLLCAKASDTNGRYAKRKAWQDVRKYFICVVCTTPVITSLIVFIAVAGQTMATGV